MPAPGYYTHARHDLLDLLPPGVQTVLEVGCGTGGTAAGLRKRGVNELVGIEMNAEAAAQARSRFDRILLGPAEHAAASLNDAEFDLILYGDVLEHLVDPWSVLRAHRRLLKPEGHILVSVPNVRHWRLVLDLVMRGRWTYQEDGGTLDRTHLRFFTIRELRAMVVGAGFRPIAEGHNVFGGATGVADRLTFGALHDFLVWQHFLLARLAMPAGPLA